MPHLNTKPHSGLWKIGVFALLALLGGLAWAQVPGQQPLTVGQITGATQSTDISKMIWKFVLGDFAENPFSSLGSPTTLLGGMFVIFNTAIFSVGMIWLTYGIGSGIIGTAQDGQALGQRINSAWYPIRVVTGVSGLVPIFSGFTGSQAIIMWVGGLGIGIANLLWTGAVNNPGAQQLVNTGNPDLTSVSNSMDVAKNLFLSNVCMIGKARAEQDAARNSVPIAPSDLMTGANVGGWWSGSQTRHLFGSANNPDLCGSITVSQANGFRPTGASASTGTSTFGFTVASVNYAAINQGMEVAYKSAADALSRDMQAQAGAWVASRDSAMASGAPLAAIDMNQLQASVNRYQSAVNAGVSSNTSGQINALQQDAKGNMLQWGWISAGAWFATFAEANSAMADAIKATTISSEGPKSSVGDTLTTAMIGDAKAALEVAQKATGSPTASEGAITNALKETGCDAIGGSTTTGNCSFGQMIVSKAINFSSNGVGAASSNTMIAGVPVMNPIVMFKNMGDYVMSFSSVVILTGAAADVISSFADDVPIAGKLLKKVPGAGTTLKAAGWLGTMGWVLMFVGALMALYIPMIPFIIWMGAVIGYAASFLEGLIAMPLHSLSHLDTDGEGMGQRTGHGYLFLLNTLARPALMVVSFFIASGLLIVIGTFQAALFLPAMANVQGNSVTGLFSIVGLLLIFFIMNVTLINSCFELINVIPDQVIGFVGAGSVNTNLGRDTESKINGMFAMSVRGAQGGLQGAAKMMGRKPPKSGAPSTPKPA